MQDRDFRKVGEFVAPNPLVLRKQVFRNPRQRLMGPHLPLLQFAVNIGVMAREDGGHDICQLVAYNLTDFTVKCSWIGPGRLHLVLHVNALVADRPVSKIVAAHHFIADLTLPYGRVVHDYLKAP